MDSNPRKVIVKTMMAKASFDRTFDFFENMKSIEVGGTAKSVTKGADGWWTFDHVVAGRSKMKHTAVRELGILDHVFVGGA